MTARTAVSSITPAASLDGSSYRNSYSERVGLGLSEKGVERAGTGGLVELPVHGIGAGIGLGRRERSGSGTGSGIVRDLL